MSINSVEAPFPIFTDIDGSPLEDGYIYIGEANQNPEVSPINAYWDSTLTVPAAQPIRTIGGYASRGGSAARVYVVGDYSITIRDKNSTLVYTAPVATGILSSINSFASIDGLIGYSIAPENTSVNVSGYFTANDGGGGLFNWDSSVDKSTANAGTIIDPSVSLALQGTGVGTGCWMRQYSGPINVKWFGANTTRVDNEVPFQVCIDSFYNIEVDSGKFTFSSSLSIREGVSIIGSGYSIEGDTGTALIYIGAGTVFIDIDGQWDAIPWIPKRYIQISNMLIENNVINSTSIKCDFVTRGKFENLYIYGIANYHMYMENSYNNTFDTCMFRKATLDNFRLAVKNDASDNVFSGQTLFNACDFWGDGNSDHGFIRDTPYNLMEEIVFTKCHFQENIIGYLQMSSNALDGGGSSLFNGCHWEQNSVYDVKVEIGANPIFNGGFVNNALTTGASMFLDGQNGRLDQVRFNLLGDSVKAVSLGQNSNKCNVDIVVRRPATTTTTGSYIYNEGEQNTLSIDFTDGNVGARNSTLIENTSNSDKTYIDIISASNTTGATIVDSGTNTVFIKAKTLRSPLWAVDGGEQKFDFQLSDSGYINRAWISYPTGTGASITAIQLGRSVTPGTEEYARYLSASLSVSATSHKVDDLTLSIATTNFLSNTDVLIAKCNGTSTDANFTAQLVVEVTPYNALQN